MPEPGDHDLRDGAEVGIAGDVERGADVSGENRLGGVGDDDRGSMSGPTARPPKRTPPAISGQPSPPETIPARPSSPDATEAAPIDVDLDGLRVSSTSIPASTPPPPLAMFGRYAILGRLAVGGMAEIFLAREDTEGGVSRQLVVKVARPHLTELAGFDEMFMNEGRVAVNLSHPNICHVYEFGKEHDRYFMAMEWIDGVSVRELAKRANTAKAPLPVPVVLRVASQVAEALDFAHRGRDSRGRPLQIVHRDVSPHNIMVSYDGVVKLLDFGVAKGRNTKETTQSGTVKGKFSYMAPEQCVGGEVDARADVFALGVCMWEALSGRMLFKRETQYETFRAILEESVPSLGRWRGDIPEGLSVILDKALAKAVEARYHTAADLHDDIEKLLQKEREIVSTSRVARTMRELFAPEIAAGPKLDRSPEIISRALPPDSLSPVSILSTPSADELSESPSPTSRRAAWIIPAVAATLGVLAGVILILSLAGEDPPPSGDTSPRERVQEASTLDTPPPDETESDTATPAVVVDSHTETLLSPTEESGPQQTIEEGEEPTANESASERARRQARSMRRPSMGRMNPAGFVTDPGF